MFYVKLTIDNSTIEGDKMKNKILRFFSSNVRIKVSGRNVNNFVKRLIKNRINIIKFIPISYKEADIIIDYNDLEKVKEYKTIYDLKIVKYYGKLKILKLFKKNVFLLTFMILGFLIIYFLSNIIFSVDIIHSNNKIIKLLDQELTSRGIKKYSFVKSYQEIEKIEEEILEENKDNLEWIEITREGTKYIVKVEERIINKEIEENKIYDIVASKNAVIKTIIAESGEKVKEINTYVKKGEVIISSDILLPNNETVRKKAQGKVIGEVWYTINIDYPYYYHEITYTGKEKEVLVLNFLNKRFSLFDFHKYKTFDKDTKVIFTDIFFPLSLVKETQYETNVIGVMYTYEDAREKAIELAKDKLKEKYHSIEDITKVTIIKEEELSEKISLSLFITCTEDITEYREAAPDLESNPS